MRAYGPYWKELRTDYGKRKLHTVKTTELRASALQVGQRGPSAGEHYVAAAPCIRPRDAEESELLLELDQDTLQWETIERDELAHLDQRRRQVLEWVTKQKEPVTPKSLTEALGGESAANRRLLMKMANDGQLNKPARGQYTAVGHTVHNGHDDK